MSAIQPMDVATPHSAMPVPVSSGSGAAEAGHPFAEVMRSAVSPAQMTQTAQKSSNPSNPSASSRQQFSHSATSAGSQPKRADVSASNSFTPDASSKASMPAEGLEEETVESSVSMLPSADPNGVAASPVNGQVQSPILVAAAGDRSNGMVLQQGRTTAAPTATSASDTGRKQASTARKANSSENTSGSSAIVTVTTTVRASVSAIAPNLPNLNLSTALTKGSTAAIESPRRIDARAPDKNSSSSASSATTLGAAPHIPQADGATAMAGMLQHAPSISTDAVAASHNPIPLRGTQAIEGGSATPSNSDATSTGESKGDGEASRPALVGDGISSQARTYGSANVAGDASSTSSVSASGPGNSVSTGNDAVGTSGNGSATSIHVNDSSKRSDFTAAMPTPTAASKDLPDSHVNPLDSSVKLQSGASVYSAGGHAASTGNFFASTTPSTTASATTADAFTALDSAATGERGVLLHAAPHQVAVGVSDPSLGWVEVRAERVSGQIAAALTPSSAASHAALTSVLPTMATYLQEHQAGVQQVHVESLLSGGQAGTGSHGQASPQSQARTAPDNTTPANAATSSWNAIPVASATVASGQRSSFINEGHHFSIRA